jgi:hypothetical protein
LRGRSWGGEVDTHDFGGAAGFVGGYFFDGALNFDEVDILVTELDDVG